MPRLLLAGQEAIRVPRIHHLADLRGQLADALVVRVAVAGRLELVRQDDQPQKVPKDQPFVLGQVSGTDELVEIAVELEQPGRHPLGLDEDRFRVHAAEPMLSWFEQFERGHRITLEDITESIAAVAVQGPTSRDILKQLTDVDMDSLAYYRVAAGKVDGLDAHISRSGFTGDLGFEIWVENSAAAALWDGLMAAGKPYLLQPAGLDVLDITRVEAGLILNGVDFHNAAHCLIESQQSSPFELGLGWTVDLEREPFCGQRALIAEQAAGPMEPAGSRDDEELQRLVIRGDEDRLEVNYRRQQDRRQVAAMH